MGIVDLAQVRQTIAVQKRLLGAGKDRQNKPNFGSGSPRPRMHQRQTEDAGINMAAVAVGIEDMPIAVHHHHAGGGTDDDAVSKQFLTKSRRAVLRGLGGKTASCQQVESQ